MEVKSENEVVSPSNASAAAVPNAPASSSGSTGNDSALPSSSGTVAPALKAKTSAPEESESLDLIMVVTNETIDEDSVVGRDRDNAVTNTKEGAASANNPEGAAGGSTASLDTSERLENKTPRASGSASKGGFDAPVVDGANKEDNSRVPENTDKQEDEKKTTTAAPVAAPPTQYHPYHYHHNTGYPQYPHPQWNPQWNNAHARVPHPNAPHSSAPHPSAPHPFQSQHPQPGYHPYYSRYPWYGHHQYNHGGATQGASQLSNQGSQHGHHNQAKLPSKPTSQKPPNTVESTEDKAEEASAKTETTSNTAKSTWSQHANPYPNSNPYPHHPHWRSQYYNYNYYNNWRNNNIHRTASNASASTGEATRVVRNKEKKRSREESGRGEEDRSRDIGQSYTDDTASTLSIGGLSMATSFEQPKASSPKRHKGYTVRNQNIHRDLTSDTSQDFPQLGNTSTLSEGKMILQNLSINSLGSLRQSYSAEIAELCGPSPINVDKKLYSKGSTSSNQKVESIDEGKTPKKRNTSSKKKDSSVFRLDHVPSTTPAAMRLTSQDDDSPGMMLDLMATDTPLLLNSVENIILDDSISKQLHGQAFTPLPHILGGDDVWSFNGSPLASASFDKLTPRLGLDSTKSSSRGTKNPLASPKSFWKDDFLEEHEKKKSRSKEKGKQEGVRSILSMLSPAMRAMDSFDQADGGPTSPIPINRKIREDTARAPRSSSIDTTSISTPHRNKNPAQVTSASRHPQRPHQHHGSSPWRAEHHRRGPPPGIMHSPIPTHHHHPHHGISPYDGRYGDHHRPRDGHPYHGMYPPSHHGHYNPDDRIRNLRGRHPPIHYHMPPTHHLPPPSYHHFSPLTNVPRTRNWHDNQHGHLDSSIMSSSKRKCIPLRPPVPAKFQGDIEKFKDAQVPEFNNLVNFPGHMNQKQSPNVPDGMRCCVMCGQACPCSQGGKMKKDKTCLAPLGNNKNLSNIGNGFAIIPTQNKGLCTLCDVNVWIVTQTGLEIKWCKGCKNFRPWAAFGDKGLATKCVRCRDRQREKYALQKEEKERQRGMSNKHNNHGMVPAMPPMSMGMPP